MTTYWLPTLTKISVTSQKYTNENEALMCLLPHTDPTGNPNKKIKMNMISFMTMLYVRIQTIYSYHWRIEGGSKGALPPP